MGIGKILAALAMVFLVIMISRMEKPQLSVLNVSYEEMRSRRADLMVRHFLISSKNLSKLRRIRPVTVIFSSSTYGTQ